MIFKSLSKLLKSVSFANFFHLSLNQGVNVIVALLANPILYQRLGEDEYGLVSLALSIVMLLSIIVNYGFHLNGPKRLALITSDISGQSRLTNEIVVTKVLLATILAVGMLVFTYLFGLFPNYSTILIFSLVVLLAEAVYPIFILQGFDRLSWLSLANGISKLGYLVLIYLFVQSYEDAPFVNFAFGGSTLLVNLLLLIYVYRKLKLKFYWVKLKQIKERIIENFQFFLSTIAGHISVHGGLIILTNFVSDIELSRYALAQRVAFLLRMIPVFLTQSILQNASRLFEKDKKAFESYLKRAYWGGLSITFLVGLVFSIGSSWVIRIVGGEFVDYSANVLRLLSFIPFLGMLNVVNMIKILVAEYKDVLAKATWVSAVVMLIFSIVGCYYWGGYGLAISLMISEVFSFTIHYILIKRKPAL